MDLLSQKASLRGALSISIILSSLLFWGCEEESSEEPPPQASPSTREWRAGLHCLEAPCPVAEGIGETLEAGLFAGAPSCRQGMVWVGQRPGWPETLAQTTLRVC